MHFDSENSSECEIMDVQYLPANDVLLVLDYANGLFVLKSKDMKNFK